MSPPPALPNVVATVGLHGSASTWVFNVTRELLVQARGADHVLTAYADDVAAVPDPGRRCLIVKSHHGSAGLDEWLVKMGARMLLSIRDPRDAAVSMAQRFNTPLTHTVRWLVSDCTRMQALIAAGHPLFRYEDRFFEDEAAAQRLAALLEVDLPADAIALIASNYRPDAVRRFTQAMADLPPGRVVRSGAIAFDTLTQLHQTHIGDARTGKWRMLPPATQAQMTRTFKPFLKAFGYPLWSNP